MSRVIVFTFPVDAARQRSKTCGGNPVKKDSEDFERTGQKQKHHRIHVAGKNRTHLTVHDLLGETSFADEVLKAHTKMLLDLAHRFKH